MAHFWRKPWKNLWKNLNSSTFSTSCLYSLERRFFVLEYRKRYFPGLYCPKKKTWKNGHFWTKNHGLTPLEKCEFFNFSTSCFYSLERRFFVLEYRKRYFSGPYCPKKKVGKMTIFGPKPWVNPFGKMSIFGLFQLRVFIV